MGGGVTLVLVATVLVCVVATMLLDTRSVAQRIVGVLVGAATVGIPVLLLLWLTDITRDTATRKKWLRQSESREELAERIRERLLHHVREICCYIPREVTLDSRFVDDLKFG